MASAGFRSLSRASLSGIQACLSSSRSKAAARLASSSRQPAAASAFPAPDRRFPPFSRFPAQLGCCSGSLLPLHSAVAVARLSSCLSSTSRCCRAISQDGIDDT
ncbi:protein NONRESPONDING TO OXYLIPINS 2, mitochondrial-like [Zingiber officinale]|uniref:protein NONRESPONDING TO OXYLIPINS 2, mitochondrial-like n=1 Tax=Zingiber officinale TaxID=94328 RepID=UPI001C4C491A|nr:protein NONRESPONDING TO OXYLIPINS 2, mitochondrial-like [Zingiber officinale]